MWAKLHDGQIIIGSATPEEVDTLTALGEARDRHVWVLTRSGGSLVFHPLGEEPTVRQTPINITSQSEAPLDLISNFAATPFILDGLWYAGIEGFWQSLRFADPKDRSRVAKLVGREAKQIGNDTAPPERFDYKGQTIVWGTWAHWQLMRRACFAKFEQNEAAREALLSTRGRPLMHKVRRDSRSIPGVIMAEIWMDVRRSLSGGDEDEPS